MADELWSVLLHWDGMCTAFKCTIPLLCTMTPGITVNAVFHYLSSSRYMIGRGYMVAQLVEGLCSSSSSFCRTSSS